MFAVFCIRNVAQWLERWHFEPKFQVFWEGDFFSNIRLGI